MQQASLDAYRALVQRRASVSRWLLGRSKGFHAIDLKVDRRVLIPRPETELLVDRALALFGDNKAPRFVDIGNRQRRYRVGCVDGSAEAHAVATDVSDDALSVAAKTRLPWVYRTG